MKAENLLMTHLRNTESTDSVGQFLHSLDTGQDTKGGKYLNNLIFIASQ